MCTLIAALILLILLSGCFSGTETAFTSLSIIKVRSLLKNNIPGARLLIFLKQHTHRVLITILIGNNIVNIAASVLATILFTDLFGSAGPGISMGVMTLLVLVFGEITPKTFATQNAERLSLIAARPLHILMIALKPLVILMEALSTLLSRFFSSSPSGSLTTEEVRSTLTIGTEQGVLPRDIANMMSHILDFGTRKVTKIMTPRGALHFFDEHTPVFQILREQPSLKHSRYPVFRDDKDIVTGIISSETLNTLPPSQRRLPAKEIASRVYFFPKTKNISDAILFFKRKETDTILIIDEYGSVIGMLTTDDIIDDIAHTHVEKPSLLPEGVTLEADGSFLIHADTKIDQLRKVIILDDSSAPYDTVAGLVQHHLGAIPRRGEKLSFAHGQLVIEKVSASHIETVRFIPAKKKHAHST